MTTQRLEAFSDAVIAIVITILVLEFKIPHEPTIEALLPLWPVFVSYVLSFLYLAIYWNNHHHMLHVTQRANGTVLWANMHLLFWLSLLPFVTGWLGENAFAAMPAAVYGFVLLMAAIAYYVLEVCIIRHEGSESKLRKLVGKSVRIVPAELVDAEHHHEPGFLGQSAWKRCGSQERKDGEHLDSLIDLDLC